MAKNKNPWGRLPPLDVGDAEAVLIYTNVGIALSRFETLQVRMSWLFQVIVGIESSLALARAFGTLESVPAKASMIQAAADIRFMNKPDLLRKVQDFMTRLNALSQRRNEIAHGYVSKLTTNGEDVGHFLHPGSHMTHRNTTFLQFDGDAALGDYRYTAAQINHYTEEFRRLGGEVQDFINELRGKQNPGSPAS